MSLSPKENYLKMLSGEIPDYVPSFYEPYSAHVGDELLTPQSAPDGPIVTSLGVTYIGSPENMFGAMPAPNQIIIDDIKKWPEQLKIRDVSDRDWEGYYKEKLKDIDRSQLAVSTDSGDYFLTLVSLMGYTGALTAMYEEPEEVKALLTHISEFYTLVLRKQFEYMKPDIYILMDDDSAYRAPFFSLDMYREIFKPFHKLHTDIAIEHGALCERHDCGHSEQFIDDWLDIGIKGWSPIQDTNDAVAIKKKYVGRLAMGMMWDSKIPWDSDEQYREEMTKHVDTFAPGGGFSFGIFVMGPPDDPETKRKNDYVKGFFDEYVRDYYKTH